MEELGSRETIQWYERDFTLEDAMGMIQGSMKSAVRHYVATGFYLKAIRDRKLFEEAGYRNFEEFVRDKVDKDKGWASKCIKVNDKLSKGGNSPLLADEYKDYSVSQLVELAAMTEEQRAQVTPETSVREMKQIRNPKPEEPEKVATLQLLEPDPAEEEKPEPTRQEMNEPPLSAYGTLEMVYPEGSLIAMKGCEGGHGCFSCHLKCNIRQEECYCVEAPLGNPFPCTTMNIIGSLRAEIGSRCQFIDLELACHRAGDHEPVPCCKKCNEICEYRCDRSEQPVQEPGEPEPEVIDAEFTEIEDPDENLTDLEIARQELERANNLLTKCLKDLPDENNVHIRGMKLKVAALASFVCDLEDIENPPPEPEQPKLPTLRNNDQRKEWLENFRNWPVWFEVPEASEVYYRYDLPDGSSIVICEYRRWVEWMEQYANENPDKAGEREYLLKPGYHYLHDCLTNRTMLVEKLKEIQKKG